jgi:hypothetical protein
VVIGGVSSVKFDAGDEGCHRVDNLGLFWFIFCFDRTIDGFQCDFGGEIGFSG